MSELERAESPRLHHHRRAAGDSSSRSTAPSTHPPPRFRRFGMTVFIIRVGPTIPIRPG
jgi:hypothetical protein